MLPAEGLLSPVESEKDSLVNYAAFLDASWLGFRQKLLEAYAGEVSRKVSPVDSQMVAALKALESTNLEKEEFQESTSRISSRHSSEEEQMLSLHLEGVSEEQKRVVRQRLRSRLGVISYKALVTGRQLLDAVSSLGLTKYNEEDMNELVNRIADFIQLAFEEGQTRRSSSGELWFSEIPNGKPVWSWPRVEEGARSERNGEVVPRKYNVVPVQALLDAFLTSDHEFQKRLFGSRLNQFMAMKEILMAGDTNRLVAELTFVRINDLATPPEPVPAILYMEPFVAVLIVANGIMIGMEMDPLYKDWHGWLALEIVFAILLIAEIMIRLWVSGCREYWWGAGQDKLWNYFDVFLVASGSLDIIVQLFQDEEAVAGTSLLRLARLVRLVRIVKVFRIKWMRDLRLMVKGLLAGLRTLSLAFILLSTVLYVTSGLAVMYVGQNARTVDIRLEKYFDSIPNAMFTAFRCFTGECVTDDGKAIPSILADEYGLLFKLAYVASYMFVAMGINNVILAVYVDITMKAAKENDLVTAEQHSRESVRIARATRDLLKMFSRAYNTYNEDDLRSKSKSNMRVSTGQSLYTEEDGMHDKIAITKELFLLVIQDQGVQALMDELDLPPDRANLFEIIDADGSGTLQITELLQGLLKMRGDISKSDTVAPLLATKAMQEMLGTMKEEFSKSFLALRAEVVKLRRVCQPYASKTPDMRDFSQNPRAQPAQPAQPPGGTEWQSLPTGVPKTLEVGGEIPEFT